MLEVLIAQAIDFSNFGSLKSTETPIIAASAATETNFSNFGSLKSTETLDERALVPAIGQFQQFRLVEEH